MVIFNCNHYGALSQMIVLRYKFHKNEETVLLISRDSSKTDIYQALEDKKFFDKVIPYNMDIGSFEGNKERATQVICDYFQNLFQEAGINLIAAEKVYISSDTTCPFGIFAYKKRIAYSMVEFNPGQLTNFKRYEYREKDGNADRAYSELLREASALTGDENLVETYVLVLPRPREKSFSTHKRTVYIDFTKELSLLSDEVKEKILSVYHISSSDFTAIDTLILTNSKGILKQSGLPEEKFPYLYQLLLDYYVTNAGRIVVKRHPYGLLHYTGRIPDMAGNINGLLPIEFIAFFQDVKIKNVVVVESTSVDKIAPYVNNVFAAGMDYYRNQHFQMLHQLYVAYSLAGSIGDQNIEFYQTLKLNFLQRYLHYVFPQYGSKELKGVDPNTLKGNAFTVIDRCPPTKEADICDGLQNAGEDAITVFLNSDESFDFYDSNRPELLDQMIPVKITKTALRENILADMEDEYIYVFAKDAEVREKVRTFSLSKTLYYTGIKIEVVPLEASEIDLIKMEIRLRSVEVSLKKAANQLTELRKTASLEDSDIDLTKMKICLEDMETARKEIVNCLTEW